MGIGSLLKGRTVHGFPHICIWATPKGQRCNMEQWKDIKGYEGKYQISNMGRVKSLPRNDRFCKRAEEIVLKTFICGSGYQEVILKVNGQKKPKLIHRLVAEAFVPNPTEKIEVNHKDGNKHNNDYTNLEWVTPSENIRHSYDVLQNKGYSRKVVCVETREVFNSIKEAANRLKLHSELICACCNGRQRTTGGYHWEYAD